MQHRHLRTREWTKAAIDSALERGDLPDWRELFAAVRKDRSLGQRVLEVCRAHRIDGASDLAEHLVLTQWPDLGTAGRPAA